jgi:hypothetical protein
MMPVRFAVVVLAFAWLGGCADSYAPKGEPSFYRNLAQQGAELGVSRQQRAARGCARY